MKFLVLYGSETGTAQDVAERIWRQGKSLGMSGPVLAMDDYDITELPNETLAIFICSTTGQGDQPTNMKKFWRFLLRKNLPLDSLKNLSFAVLGLGDSSYSKFNYAGKKLLKRLNMLGGRLIIPGGWADDQHDLGSDAVVDPWIDQLVQQLTINYPQLSTSSSIKLTTKWDVELVKDGVASEFVWPLSPFSHAVSVHSNIRTTPLEHFQEVRLIRFDSTDDILSYKHGDVAVIRPNNCKNSVDSMMKTLAQYKPSDVLRVRQIDKDMPVPPFLAQPVSLLHLATCYWDLQAIPRRSVLETLSRLNPGTSEELALEKDKLSELASSSGQEDYFNYVTRPRRSIVELLSDFPYTSACISPSYLFDIFQPIRPRMFSIASPPQSKYVEILVAVVKYKTRLVEPRLGLCSNYLANLTPGSLIQLTIKTGSLNFPKKGKLLMVGPGTGIAPFRSFICSEHFSEFVSQNNESKFKLQPYRSGDTERVPSLSPVTLVFGCRNKQADFHFEQDLTNRTGLKLFTAFSRDQPHKIYVQNVIEEEREYFSKLLTRDDICIMIAGNAKDMPEQVKQAFISCLSNTMTAEEASKHIDRLQSTGQYQTETWS